MFLTYFPCFVVRLFLFLYDVYFCCETFLPWEFFCSETFYFPMRLLFPCETFYFPVRLFISLWDFLFPREACYFSARLFISSWDFLFLRWTFYFFVRLLFSHWEFLFLHENVAPENYFTKSDNFWSTIKERFGRVCNLCLVVSARPFYNLEYKDKLDKEKVYRAKLYHVSETF